MQKTTEAVEKYRIYKKTQNIQKETYRELYRTIQTHRANLGQLSKSYGKIQKHIRKRNKII